MTDRISLDGSADVAASTTRLAASRHREILDLLAEEKEIQVSLLSERLDVSPETIRRDLRLLEESGKLQRVHGGAVLLRGKEELPYLTRIETLRSEKERMAEILLDRLDYEAGSLIFMGGGSTTLPLARKLAHLPPARFVTNTIDVAYALAGPGQHEVTITGGQIKSDHELLVGFDMLNAVRGRVFDLVITGTNAIDPVLGFLEHEEAEAKLHQVLDEHSRRYIILADHTKFGRSASFAALPLGAIDLLVTDRQLEESMARAFKRADVPAVWASSGPD